MIKYIFIALFLFIAVIAAVGGALSTSIPSYNQSAQYQNEAFVNNPKPSKKREGNFFKIFWRFITEETIDAEPNKPIPLLTLNSKQINNSATNQTILFRLGHSSLLLKMSGKIFLIDPVFSQRASPFSWVGPKRFHPVPLNINDFNWIDGIIISHDHYDHLDKATIIQLAKRTQHFYVPLGVGARLEDWGIASNKVSEFDWWESRAIDDIELTATPSQHFSGRGLHDRNKTLWASWAIKNKNHAIFYSGDSGYFNGFKKIGNKLGPFDIAILENGAYNNQWPTVHMLPSETIKAHKDLQAQALMPVHNSTFDLALHAWYEPLDKISVLAQQDNILLATPIIGEPYIVGEKRETSDWWRVIKK